MKKELVAKNAAMALMLFLFAGVAISANLETGPKKMENKEARLTTSAWYAITPTTSSNKANQQLVSGIPIPPPPVSGDCAQDQSTGLFCAVQLRFDGTEAPELTSDSVQDAIDHEDAQLDTNEDGTSNDGYAKTNPNP